MEKILVSACLLGENCRYDGMNKLNKELLQQKKVRLIPFCPEVAGGLSIPRKPGEIINHKVFSQDGLDLTSYYQTGAIKTLELVKENKIKVAILKEDSPSCGVKRIYDGTFKGIKILGQGITTKLLIQNGIKVLDENEGLEYLKNL